eukprot:scaffold1842_cov148-Amphora_coffeaeformis.AAC.6
MWHCLGIVLFDEQAGHGMVPRHVSSGFAWRFAWQGKHGIELSLDIRRVGFGGDLAIRVLSGSVLASNGSAIKRVMEVSKDTIKSCRDIRRAGLRAATSASVHLPCPADSCVVHHLVSVQTKRVLKDPVTSFGRVYEATSATDPLSCSADSFVLHHLVSVQTNRAGKDPATSFGRVYEAILRLVCSVVRSWSRRPESMS